jgi:hypothetical protein
MANVEAGEQLPMADMWRFGPTTRLGHRFRLL